MHPHTFYSTLFAPHKRDEVFVVMSFAPEFDERWLNVIEPAIRSDLKLTPNRVDYNISGESVVHDILDGIAHARLVLADITSSTMTDSRGGLWPQRNGNVMWEVGIAHVMRMPDEVLLVRSDHEKSIFDLTQFRAFTYDPADHHQARRFLVELAADRLRGIEQSKSEYVRRCAESLDPLAMSGLINQVPADGTQIVLEPNMLNGMVFPRLFELGLVRAIPSTKLGPNGEATGFVAKAEMTEIGRAVGQYVIHAINPEWGEMFAARFSDPKPDESKAIE
jgi:hypothetical protein